MGDAENLTAGKVQSTFAHDPEYAPLIELFVDEMPERVRAIESAVAQADNERLCRIVHQLKGSAAGYGFAVIGDAASRVEAEMNRASDGVCPIEGAADKVRALIGLCRLASGDSGADGHGG